MSRRLQRLHDAVAALDAGDADALIAAGAIEVDGFVATNPASRVPTTARVRLRRESPLRGSAKLLAALAQFDVPVTGRVALDVGAAAGGFTRALLESGARRVYAVDAGHGQLLGSLRQDARVVNLETTNVADLDGLLVPETIEVVTIDVSYLALGSAVSQLGAIRLAPGANLIGLVKPMFELRRARAPVDDASLAAAVERARAGVESAGWRVVATMPSPVLGTRGAREALLHARRSAGPTGDG